MITRNKRYSLLGYPGTHIDPTVNSRPFLINCNPNLYSGNYKIDDFIVEQRVWSPSEVKNQYSQYKGFF
jgi:hypothetical protein